MQEEFITTGDTSGPTSDLIYFKNFSGKIYFKFFLVISLFLNYATFANAQQDSIQKVEVKITLKEKSKPGIDYDSLFQISTKRKPVDSILKNGKATFSTPFNIIVDSLDISSVDTSNILKRNLALKDSSLKDNLAIENTKKNQDTLTKTNFSESVKNYFAVNKILYLRVGFILLVIGLILGAIFGRYCFSIAAIGAIVVIVALLM